MAKTLVLGLGNILLSDEGVGVRAVERLLETYEIPEGVEAMDGGTLGLDLLHFLEDTSHLVLVDAVQARKAPGTLVRLEGDEIPIFLDASKVSAHQEGLQDLLAVSAFRGALPPEVVFWGVQVESMEIGLDLSPAVAAQLDSLVAELVAELANWGIELRAKAQLDR